MNLHNEIMNIQVDRQKEAQATLSQGESDIAYRKGHRDARHAAAELSLKSDARIEELEDVLEKAKQLLINVVNPFTSNMSDQEIHTTIISFLQDVK